MDERKLIGLSETFIGEEEKRAVCSVLESGWLSSGDTVAAFERQFAMIHQKDQAIAVSSCTAGLHVVLAALGIGTGDEVLVPGVTFVATVNAVLYTGATAVPVDVDSLEQPHMALDAAFHSITPRTKAVIVMHYAGYTTHLQAWATFCKKHHLYLIEDAAHAAGVSSVGTVSDAAVFSFFANKNMTTAEGGMIVTADPAVAEKCRLLRAHAMTSPTLERSRGHAFSYDVVELGYNYRLDEVRAAIGIVQLSRLMQHNVLRKQLVHYYRELLCRNIPEVIIPFHQNWESAYHLMPVILPGSVDRHAVMSFMRDAGVQTSIHYPPYHKFTWHSRLFSGVSLPVTEAFVARELSLPLHPGLQKDDVLYVVETLRAALDTLVANDAQTDQPSFAYDATLKEAWELFFANNLTQAHHLFSLIANTSLTPEAARAGLVAVEMKQKNENSLEWYQALLDHHVACCESWKIIAEEARDLYPALADTARKIAEALEK